MHFISTRKYLGISRKVCCVRRRIFYVHLPLFPPYSQCDGHLLCGFVSIVKLCSKKREREGGKVFPFRKEWRERVNICWLLLLPTGEKEASSLLPAIKRINVGLKNGSLGGREIGNNTPPLTKSGLPIPREEYFFPAKKEGENMGKS